MIDKSWLLKDVLKKGWPTQADFREGRVISPLVTTEIHRRLQKHRICMLVGPPRAGKTTLACLIGYEIQICKVASPFRWIRYLDLTEIEHPDEVQDIIHMNKAWLLIIDNWHAAADCHNKLINRLTSDWKDIGCLIVETQFPESGGTLDVWSPLVALKQGAENTPIYTDTFVHEIARGMVELHVQQQLSIEVSCRGLDLVARAKSKNAHFDQEDYESALVAPTEHKKVRSNLRFLAWRLRAWNPTECHLRDLPLEAVMRVVDQTIVAPYSSPTGTLEKIAALAQWEILYLRAAGQNPLEGIRELERKNIVVRMKRSIGWRLDSTDAYLIMLTTSSGRWITRSLELITQYLESFPEQTPRVIGNLLKQAEAAIATDLIVGLLANPLLREAERQSLLERATSGQLNFGWLSSLVNCIFRDWQNKQEEADMRLDIIDTLLSNEIGSAAGKSARTRGLQPIKWLLANLSKAESRYEEFVESFFEGYGKDALVTLFFSTSSWSVRRGLLQYLRRCAPFLYNTLYPSSLLLSHSPQEIPLSAYFSRIQIGSIETGFRRRRKIEALASIDEEYLISKLTGDPRAADRLQWLLQSALWLDRGQAWRLAGIVPRIWPKLGLAAVDNGQNVIQDGAKKLGYLVKNCWFANPEAAQDLVLSLLGMSLRAVVPPDWASGIGRFLYAVERVRPGAIKGWSSTDIDYMSDLVLSMEGNALDEFLVPMAVCAPEVLARIVKNNRARARQKLGDISVCHCAWFRRGVLNLCGELEQTQPLPSMPLAEEIATYEPVYTVLALYALHLGLGLEATHSVLSSLAKSPKTSTWIPLLLARTPMPWTAKQVSDMAGVVMKEGSDPRANTMYDLILAGMMLQSIEWARGYKFDVCNSGHRALQAAIHGRMLEIKLHENQRCIRARISDRHSGVRSSCYIFREILNPFHESLLSLEEWDCTLSLVGTTERRDYFRSKAIRAGIVEWSVTSQAGRLEPRFSVAAKIDKERLYGLIGLPLSESSADKVVTVDLVPADDEGCGQAELTAFIRQIEEFEVTKRLISVKGLWNKFSGEEDMQDCLNAAIHNEILLTYYVANPKNQTFPTLACRLNREHPLVQDVLETASGTG